MNIYITKSRLLLNKLLTSHSNFNKQYISPGKKCRLNNGMEPYWHVKGHTSSISSHSLHISQSSGHHFKWSFFFFEKIKELHAYSLKQNYYHRHKRLFLVNEKNRTKNILLTILLCVTYIVYLNYNQMG